MGIFSPWLVVLASFSYLTISSQLDRVQLRQAVVLNFDLEQMAGAPNVGHCLAHVEQPRDRRSQVGVAGGVRGSEDGLSSVCRECDNDA